MIKGIDIDLEGKVYTVPPLNLGALEKLQDRLLAFTGGIDKDSVATVLDAAYLALRRNYPEMTREDVAGMIDVANMEAVMLAVMDVSGLRRKSLESERSQPGEGNSSGEAQPGSL
jgi:hypothetical protein